MPESTRDDQWATNGEQVQDPRGPALGGGRLIMLLLWALAAWILVESALALISRESEAALGPIAVSVFAGVVQCAAAAGVTHNGKRMRIVAGASCLVGAVGPVIVGLVGWGIPEVSAVRSTWGAFGYEFWYAPIIVNVIGLVWLWVSNPRRIVEIAEQVERPRKGK